MERRPTATGTATAIRRETYNLDIDVVSYDAVQVRNASLGLLPLLYQPCRIGRREQFCGDSIPHSECASGESKCEFV
jgi:hypothetical protein